MDISIHDTLHVVSWGLLSDSALQDIMNNSTKISFDSPISSVIRYKLNWNLNT